MRTFTTKKGDTRVCPGGTLLSPKGTPLNLVGATVRFIMKDKSTVLIDKEAVVLDAENGRVAYPWQPGETDTAGIYQGWFKVTYQDMKTETFPNSGSLLIVIG